MKYALLFTLIFLLPLINFAAIPIQDAPAKTETEQPKEAIEKTKVEKEKISFFKKLWQKIVPAKADGEGSKSSLFNWLAFGCGILAFVGIIAGSIFVAIGASAAAIVFGIIGLKKKQKMRGFGIAGLILGGAFFALVLLLVVILAAWLWND